MRLLTALLCLTLTTAGAYAAKPEWAGQDGKEKAEKLEQSGKAMKAEKEEKAGKYKHLSENGKSDKAEKAEKADKGEKGDKAKAKHEKGPRYFGDEDKDTIRDYYASEEHREQGAKGKKQKDLPPGLAKKLERGGELPPGWQTKLERGEVLDADVRATARPVPEQLMERLPVDPLVEEVVRVQDKVIRMSRGEGTIIDVIDIADVLAGRRMRE